MKLVAFFALFLMAHSAASASELTVEEAYQAIPHKRTVFDAQASTLSTLHANALKQLFDLADRGIVLRVQGLRALQSANSSGDSSVLLGYRTLASSVTSLRVPAEIESAQNLVLQSLQLHQQYFETQFRAKQSGGKPDIALRQNSDVTQASRKLIAAYGSLSRTFPNETALNRQAFYDYLCALDFL
jgi:hypothetical protein